MPEPQPDVLRQFILAGGWSWGELAAIFAALALLFGLVAVWEYRRVRLKRVFLLIPLRLTAAAIVLWMIAQPTLQNIRRVYHKKSVAVLVDTSASMGVIDPDDKSGSSLRWKNFVAPGDGPGAALESLDRAAAALAASRIALRNLASATGYSSSAETRRARTASLAHRSLEDALASLDQAAPLLTREASGLRVEFDELRGQLASRAIPQSRELADLAADPEFLGRRDDADRIEELAGPIQRLGGQLQRLADEYAAQAAEQPRAAPAVANQDKNRLELAASLAAQTEDFWRQTVDDRARLSFHAFSDELSPLAGSADLQKNGAVSTALAERGTNIAGSLAQALSAASPEELRAVVLLTDGQHDADGDPVRAATALTGKPLIVVPIGKSKPVRDVILHHVRAPQSVMQNDSILIDAMVDAHDCSGESLNVELLGENGEVLESETLTAAGPEYMTHILFRRKAGQMGKAQFALRIAPLDNESDNANNEQKFSVEVTENKIRILLVDQYPRWEFRFLRNLFRRDPRVEYEDRLFEPSGSKWESERPALPADLEAWSRYRVVILGDVEPGVLTPERQRAIEEYVGRRGGTLVVIAGEQAMPAAYQSAPLWPLIPVEQAAGGHPREGYTLALSDEGRQSQSLRLDPDLVANEALWNEVTSRLPVLNLSEFSKPRASAHVLIGVGTAAAPEPGKAFLVWQNYGRGRVVYLAAPISYQLRFRRGDLYHHRFWGQLLRWAIARDLGTGSNNVRLSTDKTRYMKAEPIQVTVRLTDPVGGPLKGATTEAIARGEGNKELRVALAEDLSEPGVYRAILKGLDPGPVTIEAAGASVTELLQRENYDGAVDTAVVIEPAATHEMTETRCNLPLLNQMAEAGGGAVVAPQALSTLLRNLDLDPTFTETTSQRSLWDRWSMLWLFAGCVCAEWVARKWLGMV